MSIRKAEAGFTLVEIIIVAAIASVLLMVVVALTTSTNDAYNTVREDTEANYSLRQALNRVSDDLRQSSASIIKITSGTDADSIDLQVPISETGTAVNYGANGQLGWHIKILVENGWLIRRITDSVGTVKIVDTVLARDVDALHMGQKGFSVVKNVGLYQITLRVTGQRNHRIWRRTETTSIVTRN